MGWPQWIVLIFLAVNFLGAFIEGDARDAAPRMLGSALMALLLNAGGFWA